MEKRNKRFYKQGEIVWVIKQKKEGKILQIDKDALKVEVEVGEQKSTLNLWEIDKLKYKARQKLVNEQPSSDLTVHFAKVKPTAIIPSKRDEDAGWDFYANVEPVEVDGKEVFELHLPANTTTLVPTGIAMALPKTHYCNLKHERGSTAKPAMSVLAGVIDSGFRGEIFVALNPLNKDVLITSEVDKVEYMDSVILYPYSKAIAQATIDKVPSVEVKEISFEELQKIESERGATQLGQSGK